MPKWTIVGSLVFMVIYRVQSVDYCSKSLCSKGEEHIACGRKVKLSKSCPGNVSLLPITAVVKSLLVGEHNRRRNMIAGGLVQGLRPACRMATMQWDDELQELAALNVRQCKIKHDKCHNTERFRHSGQNLFLKKYSPKANYAYDLKEPVDWWFAESQFTTQAIIDECSSDYKGPTIGHFTVMANERNIRLGCAAAVYNATQETHLLVACNYATSNIVHTHVYRKCKAAAVKCKTGHNSQFPNLCSPDESYRVYERGFMSNFKDTMKDAKKKIEKSLKAIRKSQKKIAKSMKKAFEKSFIQMNKMTNPFTLPGKNPTGLSPNGEVGAKNRPFKLINTNVGSLKADKARTVTPNPTKYQSVKIFDKNITTVNVKGGKGKTAQNVTNTKKIPPLQQFRDNVTRVTPKEVLSTIANTNKSQQLKTFSKNVTKVKSTKINKRFKILKKNLTSEHRQA